MIFYRSTASVRGEGPSLSTLRVFTAIALVAYPAGAALMAIGDGAGGQFAFNIGGLGLIALSLLAATPVLGSRLQRIVGDQAKELDEMELQLRHRALSWAYSTFTALALLAIFYAGVASDTGLWLPSGFDGWNGLFWGGFLYACLLPSAFLAWTMRDAPDEAD